MTGFNLGMTIEAIVAILLVITIGYCMILNKRLSRLRADEELLRGTIAELITATEIAERAILGLKAVAAECETALSGQLAEAEKTLKHLGEEIAAGDDVVHRIAAIVGAAMPAGRPAAEPHAGATRPEPASRALQSAARETAERLSAYRRSPREAAA